MEVVEVPHYFLCPISLDLMRDPVTLSTGITYDRNNIERWVFSDKRKTCPVTKQSLPDLELIPNHTLRRLIQSWCTANAANGIERFPTPRQPVDKAQISHLLDEAVFPQSRMSSLMKLKAIVFESERNKQYVEASGAAEVLVSIIKEDISSGGEEESTSSASDEALNILYSLQLSEQGLQEILSKNDDFVESLTLILRRSTNYHSRAYAVLLLKSILTVIPPFRLFSVKEELFSEMVRVLRDQISYQATKAALRTLTWLCPWGQNRVKAVEAGAVPVLIERLLEEPEKKASEMILLVLDQMCQCAEGRVEMMCHAAGVAVVAKKMIRVTAAASDRAVSILHSLAKNSATPAVLQEMMAVGAVPKLFLVIQSDCEVKTKEKAKEILRLHARVWKHSSCLAPQLQALYPSD